jgi:hypothetical protein
LVDKPLAAGSWYDERPFRPVQVVAALRSPRREDQPEVASYVLATESLEQAGPAFAALLGTLGQQVDAAA